MLTNARFIIFSFPTWPAVYWNDFTFVTPSSVDDNKIVVLEFHRVECCYALVKCLNSPCQHNVSLGQSRRENNQLWNLVLRSIYSRRFSFLLLFVFDLNPTWIDGERVEYVGSLAAYGWDAIVHFLSPALLKECSFLSGTDNDECGLFLYISMSLILLNYIYIETTFGSEVDSSWKNVGGGIKEKAFIDVCALMVSGRIGYCRCSTNNRNQQ